LAGVFELNGFFVVVAIAFVFISSAGRPKAPNPFAQCITPFIAHGAFPRMPIRVRDDA
jgi:hypothetical protein